MNLCHFRNAFLSLILIQCQADNEVGRGLDSIAGSVFLFVFCVNKKLSDKILQMGKANNLQVVIAQSYGNNSRYMCMAQLLFKVIRIILIAGALVNI